ncbi:MAG: type II toxin-antitoxin system VapC family toxin [Candidatus Bipolaricaulota bacterium]|nr:type II toxin-antitoxin system VapC family toxin [Candidatus Bipolaricaulota bacterium]
MRAKPLSKLPTGTRVFIDANVFIYHFTGVSQECREFLARCEHGEVFGVTGVFILLEVLHRLMMIEAETKRLVTPRNVAKKLKEKPEIVQRLTDYQTQVDAILEMGLEILPLDAEIVAMSERYRHEYGLLVSDSVTVALALSVGITALASADRDFERVRELALYKPTDVVVQAGKSKR